MDITKIHIWGDSIGKGIIFDEARGRYAIAKDRWSVQIQEALGITVKTHAHMGATIADGLDDLMENDQIDGSLIAIEFGGNDCDLPWDKISLNPNQPHEAKVPIDVFRSNLVKFIQKVRSLGAQPLLVTPPPLDAQRYFSWITKNLNAEAILSYLGDIQHIYRWQERYALAVRDVAEQTGCEIFDLREAFLTQRDVASYLCIDGIHPNAKGHTLIAQAVMARDRRYFKIQQHMAFA